MSCLRIDKVKSLFCITDYKWEDLTMISWKEKTFLKYKLTRNCQSIFHLPIFNHQNIITATQLNQQTALRGFTKGDNNLIFQENRVLDIEFEVYLLSYYSNGAFRQPGIVTVISIIDKVRFFLL